MKMKQMSQNGPLRQQLIDRFDAMSPQLQQAARHLIEHPDDIALLSMRELARQAGVQPATMTRLAKFVGASGYEDLRAEQAAMIRRGSQGFAARAKDRPASGPAELARDMLASLAGQVTQLSAPESLSRLTAAAAALAAARCVYVLGARSCHSVAWQFHYVMSLLGEKTVHLDGPAGTGTDPLIRARKGDALLVISVNPYANQSLEIANLARKSGLQIIAITDSQVSPLAQMADHALIVATESHTFFHSLTPALALSEVLCGILANMDRDGALQALAQADAQLDALGTYATAIPQRRIR